MLKFTKTTKVYEYMELSDDAKENAKQWYLNDDSRSYELTDIFMEDIHQIFPNSKLEVQWSLSSCQGDGVNIYGSVDLHDIFSLPGSGRAPELDWIKGFLTEKEIRTMEFYHPWFELAASDFEPSNEKPDIDKSPEEIVALFKSMKGHWEEGALLC